MCSNQTAHTEKMTAKQTITTIRVASETANRLWKIKISDRTKSMDEIINTILDCYEHSEAARA